MDQAQHLQVGTRDRRTVEAAAFSLLDMVVILY